MSLKQPQHVKKVKNNADQKDADLKRVISTILGCVLGVLGLILDPGGVPKTAPARHFGPRGVPKTAQHVRKVKNDADQKDAHWKMPFLDVF